MDAAGKDGAVKHVFGPLNPAGVHVTSFKQPTSTEKDHDYMWRINKAMPARGDIGIFNRSHYEDVLVGQVHESVLANSGFPAVLQTKDLWKQRYRHIVDWERYLVENGFAVVKIFLHVSKDEQKRRLTDRIIKDRKNWKFAMSDINERQYWEKYQEVYERVLQETSTEEAPWYVVPADNKWFARYVISQITLQVLRKLNPDFPPLAPDVAKELAKFRTLLENKTVDLDELRTLSSEELMLRVLQTQQAGKGGKKAPKAKKEKKTATKGKKAAAPKAAAQEDKPEA